jgi:hypothetical protein
MISGVERSSQTCVMVIGAEGIHGRIKNASADSQDEMTDGNKAEEDEYLVMFVWL